MINILYKKKYRVFNKQERLYLFYKAFLDILSKEEQSMLRVT